MKESIGYTVSLNIMIVFITIIVAFLCAALIYFKSNKVSNIITSSIEISGGTVEDLTVTLPTMEQLAKVDSQTFNQTQITFNKLVIYIPVFKQNII